MRHGAVLVKGGSIISTSFNKENYNSFGARFRKLECGDATHHAELGCILGVNKSKTNGSTIYVARINPRGEFRLSKPCEMCYHILRHCGVKRVVYTIDNDTISSYKI